MKYSNFKFAVVSTFLGFAMAACSPVAGDGLLSDKKDEASTLTVDKTPKSEELFLKLNTSNIGPVVTSTKLEVGGECYVSTYPNHRIVAREGTALMAIVDVSSATVDANTAKCRNGRFNFSLNVGVLSSGSHSIRVSLEAINDLTVLTTNEAQGAATLSFTK